MKNRYHCPFDLKFGPDIIFMSLRSKKKQTPTQFPGNEHP